MWVEKRSQTDTITGWTKIESMKLQVSKKHENKVEDDLAMGVNQSIITGQRSKTSQQAKKEPSKWSSVKWKHKLLFAPLRTWFGNDCTDRKSPLNTIRPQIKLVKTKRLIKNNDKAHKTRMMAGMRINNVQVSRKRFAKSREKEVDWFHVKKKYNSLKVRRTRASHLKAFPMQTRIKRVSASRARLWMWM